MDIGAWLRQIGLGGYETAFRENAIDGANPLNGSPNGAFFCKERCVRVRF